MQMIADMMFLKLQIAHARHQGSPVGCVCVYVSMYVCMNSHARHQRSPGEGCVCVCVCVDAYMYMNASVYSPKP